MIALPHPPARGVLPPADTAVGADTLETVYEALAATQVKPDSPRYENTKWGSVLSFLKLVEFITQEEEKGLAGVYGFVSPGSHRPVGISEEEMARLGRSLALGMCWFLIKCYRAAS